MYPVMGESVEIYEITRKGILGEGRLEITM